jgi:hypothetical protein
MNFTRKLSNIIFCQTATISIRNPPIYYKVQNPPCDDERSVHKMNPYIHLMCKMQNVAYLKLRHIFSQIYLLAVCLISVTLTEKK